MALKPDFQDALQSFIFSNLPILMNPSNALNVVISNDILPTTPTAPISATPTIATAPVIIISPELFKALQSYVVNNFPNIGLSPDIQQVAKEFFANLPPLIPIAPTIAATSDTTSTPTTSLSLF